MASALPLLLVRAVAAAAANRPAVTLLPLSVPPQTKVRAAGRKMQRTAVYWGQVEMCRFVAQTLGLQPRLECGVVGSRSDARAAFLAF